MSRYMRRRFLRSRYRVSRVPREQLRDWIRSPTGNTVANSIANSRKRYGFLRRNVVCFVKEREREKRTRSRSLLTVAARRLATRAAKVRQRSSKGREQNEESC